MFILHVSVSTKPSSWRYVQRHTSKANSVIDVRVYIWDAILSVTNLENIYGINWLNILGFYNIFTVL